MSKCLVIIYLAKYNLQLLFGKCNYQGAIRLKSGGHQITVQCIATSPSAAKSTIEAQYSGQIKQWYRHMASN